MRKKGQRLSEETRQKLINNEGLSKPVYMYQGGQLINVFPSLREVTRQTAFKRSSLSKACRGGFKRHGSHFHNGYSWFYSPQTSSEK